MRPLLSNAALFAIGFGLFAVISVVIAALVGFKAFASLSTGEMTVYYSTIGLLGALFCRAVIERMIPGTRRFIRSTALWPPALAVLVLLLCLIYGNFETWQFVHQGIPCLRLGCISALLSGLIGWRLFRRGYFVSPGETVLLYGFFAGLAGVAVLALHCPIRNSLHCLVWHLGAMLLAGLAGLILGRYLENQNDAR